MIEVKECTLCEGGEWIPFENWQEKYNSLNPATERWSDGKIYDYILEKLYTNKDAWR